MGAHDVHGVVEGMVVLRLPRIVTGPAAGAGGGRGGADMRAGDYNMLYFLERNRGYVALGLSNVYREIAKELMGIAQ